MAEVTTSDRESELRPFFQKQDNNQCGNIMNNLLTYPFWRSDKDKKEKEMVFFVFSSFDAVTTAIETDTAPADNACASAKDVFEEKATDGTAQGQQALQCPRRCGRRRWLLLINITQQTSITVIDKQ